MFFRASTDSQRKDASSLINSYANPDLPAECWIIGSSAKLTDAECELIQKSNLPKFACNLSGRGKDGSWKVKPTHWTSFDPSNRFPSSIHLDPTIMKFYRESKVLDLVPGTDYKLCDVPNGYFFELELRSYDDFFSQAHTKINHSLDSFIQLLDIAFMLGFRRMYLAGCELRTTPSEAQIELALNAGVKFNRENGTTEITKQEATDGKTKPTVIHSDLLSDFVREYSRRSCNGSMDDAVSALESVGREEQYKFGETKSLLAAMSSDQHYFDRAQYLRLSRKNMCLNGLVLFSTSRTSRLVPYFAYQDVATCAAGTVDNTQDDLKGLYCGRSLTKELPFHKDIPPYDWSSYSKAKKPCAGCAGKKPCAGCGGTKEEGVKLANQAFPGIIEELLVNAPKIDEVG